MIAANSEPITIDGICPATAAIIGCHEAPSLFGIGINFRARIKEALPNNLVMVQTLDGGIWSWIISNELLREARR